MSAPLLFCIFISALLYSCILEVYGSGDCRTSSCAVTCSGHYNTNWAQQIRELAEANNCETINLEISGAKFPSKILPSNWFEANKDVIKVNTLKFQSSDFERIESDALSIKGLQTLHFSNVTITYFQQSFFSHLPELLTFNVDNFVEPVRAEACLFKNIPKVETLSIELCIFEGQMISNITGQSGCPTKLQSITLQFNSLKYLPDFMVSKASQLRSVYLQASSLEEISERAFWSIPIQKIDLRNNALTTLKKETFKSIASTKWANSTLILNNNAWRCDCHLKWLQDLFLHPEIVIIDPPPMCDDGQSFEDAAFECDDGEETTLSSTVTTEDSSTTDTTLSSTSETTLLPTETTTEATTTDANTPNPDHDIITLNCRNGNDNSIDPSSLPDRELLRSFLIKVELGEHQLARVNIYNLDRDPQLELEFTGISAGVNLVYFEIFQADAPICITNITSISKSIYLKELLRNHTYTFCLLPDKETKVSPTSCFGLQLPPDWENRAWINNKDKVLLVVGIVITLVLCAIISALLAFCVIKRNPRLIDGNKDVIILKHRSKMPPPFVAQNFERPDYTEPTQFSDCRSARTQSGYMTPAEPTYEKINYYQRRANPIYGNDVHSNSIAQQGFINAYSSNQVERIGEDENNGSYILPPPTLKKVNKCPDRVYY